MRTWSLCCLVVLGGCTVAPATDLGQDPGAPDEGTEPLGDLLDRGPDARFEEGTETEEIGDCRGELRSWQCLSSGDCPEGATCSAPRPCEGESCPVGCPDSPGWSSTFPGTCQWASTFTLCSPTRHCPSGTGCFPGGPPDLGVCRGLPAIPGSCWGDLDCPASMGCVGEVRCDPTRWATCVDHPGLCLPRPGPPACLEDEDCGEDHWCDGVLLCAIGDPSCADRPGTCRSGTRPGCTRNTDCAGRLDGPVCVALSAGGTGYCSPGAGLLEGECWQDGEAWCGEEAPSCVGAAPCPPGRRCRASGMHGGICSPFPAPGEEGIRVDVLRRDDPDTILVIRNEGAHPVFVPACTTLLLETQKDGAWPEDGSFTGYAQDALCGAPGVPPALRIPPGGARVLKGLEVLLPLPSWKRVVLHFRMGCDGKDPEGGRCAVPDRLAYSEAFQ